jgi:hypothetical protein
VRSMFTCGFVPWRLRKLDNGALVPETIPLGTFVWAPERNVQKTSLSQNNTSFVENPTKRRRTRAKCSTEALSYKIRFVEGLGIMEDDVEIYPYVKPMGLHTTSLQSPISGIVGQYRLISRCLARTEYADEWNTQAKMVCSYSSTTNMYNMNEGNPITNDWSVPQNRTGALSDNHIPSEIEQNVYMRDAITEQVVASKNSPHVPTVSL